MSEYLNGQGKSNDTLPLHDQIPQQVKKKSQWPMTAGSICKFLFTPIATSPVLQQTHSNDVLKCSSLIHSKYSCDSCCRSSWIKELSGSVWQTIITAVMSDCVRQNMAFRSKTRFCSEPLQFSPLWWETWLFYRLQNCCHKVEANYWLE